MDLNDEGFMADQKKEGADKRQYTRLSQHCMVSYRKQGEKTYDMSQTRNVSIGGMYLITQSSYNPGDTFDLLIRFPFRMDRVQIVGEVVNTKKEPRGHGTCLRFIDFPADLAKELESFILKQSST